MRPNEEGQQPLKYNGFKWLLVVVLLIAGIVANDHYSNVSLAVRTAVGIVLVIILLLIASRTNKGHRAWGFVKGSRAELRKVVWPTRQETVQTTLIVVAMVVLTALILWGIDSLFMWAVGWLAGQRG